MSFRNLLLPPILLGLLWFAGIWWPAQMIVSSEQEELESLQATQLSLVAEIDTLNQLGEVQDAIERDFAAFAEAVPAEPGVDAFIATIADEGAASGVDIRLVSPTEILGPDTADPNRATPAGVNAVAFSVAADGPFGSVMTFIRDLQELDRLVVVDTLALSGVEGTDRVTVDLALRIFTSGDESSAQEEQQ